MRRARFRDPGGTVRTGEWTDDGIEAAGERYGVDEVDLLPPAGPTKILALHGNFHSSYGDESALPERPRTWWKGGPNIVAGPGDTVSIPDSGEVMVEPELAVVIGEQCRNVSASDAMDAVAGFTCGNDITDAARSNELRAKSFDGSAALGPFVVPPANVPAVPRHRVSINGEERGRTTEEHLFSVPEVVAAFASRFTLEPDDVIMMGNPGLRSGPLRDGDEVTIEVEGVGRLEHRVEVR